VQGAGGAANAATIAHSIVDLNSSFAVQVTSSEPAIIALNGAQVLSFGANNLISGSGDPTSTIQLR
jgi:hypothetical protein